MNVINFLFLAAALLLASLSMSSSHADENCLKKVLNDYCLGSPPPAGLETDNSGQIIIDDPRGAVTLDVEDDQVVSISIAMTPANWLSFKRLKVKLVRLYSTAEDISDFPASATSRSSKLNAIRAGRGYAAATWQQPGWTLLLQWNTLDKMQLIYSVDELIETVETTPTLEGL